jgi:hypothetical protein
MYQEYDFVMRFVFFDTTHMHSYYGKFANGFLWPLVHLTRSPLFYKKSKAFPRPHFEKNDFIQYTSSSVTFANTIVDEVKKSHAFKTNDHDIVVWNQDYHLMQASEVFKALAHEEGFTRDARERIHAMMITHHGQLQKSVQQSSQPKEVPHPATGAFLSSSSSISSSISFLSSSPEASTCKDTETLVSEEEHITEQTEMLSSSSGTGRSS